MHQGWNRKRKRKIVEVLGPLTAVARALHNDLQAGALSATTATLINNQFKRVTHLSLGVMLDKETDVSLYGNLMQTGRISQLAKLPQQLTAMGHVLAKNCSAISNDNEQWTSKADIQLLRRVYGCQTVLIIPMACHSRLRNDLDWLLATGGEHVSVFAQGKQCSACGAADPSEALSSVVACMVLGCEAGLEPPEVKSHASKLLLLASILGPTLFNGSPLPDPTPLLRAGHPPELLSAVAEGVGPDSCLAGPPRAIAQAPTIRWPSHAAQQNLKLITNAINHVHSAEGVCGGEERMRRHHGQMDGQPATAVAQSRGMFESLQSLDVALNAATLADTFPMLASHQVFFPASVAVNGGFPGNMPDRDLGRAQHAPQHGVVSEKLLRQLLQQSGVPLPQPEGDGECQVPPAIATPAVRLVRVCEPPDSGHPMHRANSVLPQGERRLTPKKMARVQSLPAGDLGTTVVGRQLLNNLDSILAEAALLEGFCEDMQHAQVGAQGCVSGVLNNPNLAKHKMGPAMDQLHHSSVSCRMVPLVTPGGQEAVALGVEPTEGVDESQPRQLKRLSIQHTYPKQQQQLHREQQAYGVMTPSSRQMLQPPVCFRKGSLDSNTVTKRTFGKPTRNRPSHPGRLAASLLSTMQRVGTHMSAHPVTSAAVAAKKTSTSAGSAQMAP